MASRWAAGCRCIIFPDVLLLSPIDKHPPLRDSGAVRVIVVCVVGIGLVACDGSGGVRGPEGGVLEFDAAMVNRDAGGLSDAGGRRDAGPGTGFDAGDVRRDAGPGAAAECRGVASSCITLGSFECERAGGCRYDEACTGLAERCSSQFSRFSCNGVDGCYWSSFTDSCAGSSRSCTGYSSFSSCIGQPGCRWEEDCDGVPTPCSAHLTISACLDQPGCSWR